MNPAHGWIFLRSERWCLLGTARLACLSPEAFVIGRGAVLSSSNSRCERVALLFSDSLG